MAKKRSVKKEVTEGQVRVSLGITWGRPGYSSIRYDVALESKKQKGETDEQAIERVHDTIGKAFDEHEWSAFEKADTARDK